MKNVIVTGASGNMGQAIVKKFQAEGYHVIGTMLANDTTPLQFDITNFEKAEVDLLNEEASANFIHSVAEKFKTIDAVVLTVGGFVTGAVAETSTADIIKQIQLNFETAYNIVRPVFVQMKKQNKGRIFMTGSKPGLHSFHGIGLVAYSLGKSLIFRLADLMNDEVKGMNVFTSVIVPSTIDTPQNRKSMPGAKFCDWVKPEDIADVIYYYCSDKASALRDPVIKIYGNS
jgi:NAD(P)-dependent dehydrogenase (short-subunit alcohol dehydrogenase family)